MKQKILCITLALIIMGVCGCGSSSAPASEPEVYEVEDTYTVDELVMMIESGELSLEDVYMRIASGEINESDGIMYEVESIIAEFEEEKARNSSGIVVAKIILGQGLTWNSTGTFHSTPFTLYLDVIDPDTGSVNNFKTFSSMETHSCSAGCYGTLGMIGIGSNTSVTRNYFNSDFTKMIATLTMEDGAVHVGWIDEYGQFTDVSAKVSHSSEFSGLINHQHPCFYNDYLYFMDFTNDDVQIKRVPIDSLSEASVDILVDDVQWKGNVLIYPYPDGSVKDDINAFQEYYDESKSYVANSNFFNDWISASEFVGTDDSMIYKYVLVPESEHGVFHWYSDRIALVPEIKNRKNWNAVVSPDGNKVAFLSKMTGGTDTSTSLFIVSIDGGEPTKVNTSYDLSNPSDYNNLVALFDWR